ncbi:MAG: hypothetical protein LBF79_00655 [Dysgonamonadaceae bacterium]|nr:hypothetical protein [Dysgonamonadaceae bacterium]
MEKCRIHLFDDTDSMREQSLPDTLIARIVRLRSAYTLWLNSPSKKDVEIRDHIMAVGKVNQSIAYEDIKLIKILLGEMTETSSAFHRFKFNNMIMSAYHLAEKRKDTRSMVAASAQYAKYNKLDKEEPQKIPWDEIIPQQFEPVSDPSVIGIKPVANIQQRIAELKKKYSNEIEDIQFESVDFDEPITRDIINE